MCWDGGTLGLAEKAAAQEEHMLLPASQFIHLLDPAIHVLTPNPWHTPQTRALAWTLWGKKSEAADI